jgi:PAS domain S-box-containing protein
LKDSASFRTSTFLSLLGLAITVPLLLVLGALLVHSVSVQRAQLETRVIQVLEAVVNDLDRDLDRDLTILHTLATSPALTSADWPTFYDRAKAALQGRAYLVLVDADGRQLVNTYVPYGQQPPFTGDPETVRRILRTKEPAVSNYFLSLVVKMPVFNVSIPILEDGQVRYVMSLGLLPDHLVALLNSQKLEPQWVTLIWDAKGVILARSRHSERYEGKPLSDNLRQYNQRAVFRTADLDGRDALHATSRSRISDWGIGVSVPYSLIAEPIRNSLLLWGATAVLAVAIAVSLGIFFGRQITTSLSVAAEAAAAFGRGEPFPLAGSRLKETNAFLVTLADARQAREKMSEELKLSRDWLQTTLASIGDGVVITDAKGRVSFLNTEAERLTGWKSAEAHGKDLPEVFRIVNEETRHSVENPVEKVFRQGRVVGLANHTILIAKNGTETPIDDSAAPIRDPGGPLFGVVLIFRDFTEQKKAQNALKDAQEELTRVNASLEGTVKERTAKLSEMIDELQHVSYSITHDMRAPLRAMTSFAEILLESTSSLSSESRDYCRRIMTGAARLDRLIQDALSYSRAVLQDVPLEPVELSKLVRGLLDTYPNFHPEKADIQVEGRLPIVLGNEALLTQCFSNLLGNAVKFVAPGTRPKVRVWSESRPDAVKVWVEDNGIGIPKHAQNRLFGMFQKLDNQYEGTGIGLAIVRKVVERMGGQVGVESEPGKGSRFWVSLRPASE